MKIKTICYALSLSFTLVGVNAGDHGHAKNSSQLAVKLQPTVLAPIEPMHPMQLDNQTQNKQAAKIKAANVNSSKFQTSLSNEAAAAAACDTAGYGNKSGQSLVDHILTQDASCINDLYTGNATSFSAFQSSKMVSVANSAASLANSYSASSGPHNINNLFYFLRTGYYQEYYNPGNVGPYGNDVKNAVRNALDSMTGNRDFYANSDQHGKNIQDTIVLIDSAEENARYIPVVKEWLTRWNSSYASSWNMRSSVNGIFTILFRGHQNADFKAAVQNDTQLVQKLGAFARQDWMLTTDALYLQENSAGELGRFLQHDTAPVYNTVKSEVQSVLNRYSMTGTGKSVWLRLAGQVDYYGKCADFNICGFKEQLEAQVLSQTHTCSSTLKMRVEDMTSAQFSDSCATLNTQESYFHQMLQTNNNPVADDLNSALEMIVFNNSTSYQAHAGILFGIDTNNGGMYLEGNPSDPNNQARFLAYEAEWMLPEFHIWNLTHEYVHYLDGRFNLKGDFGAAKTGTHKTVWWIEGLAEYISQKNYNDAAIALARTREFGLSTIFSNTYNSGQDRVYRWGYLAVRFMFEKHPNEVDQLLQYFRAGDFDGYLSYINNIGSTYNNEWYSWLDTVQSTNTDPEPPPSDGATQLYSGQSVGNLASPSDSSDLKFFIDVPANSSQLKVVLSGGSGDADIYVKQGSEPTSSSYDCRPYKGGNNETCTHNSPASGRWYINVKKYNAYSGVSLVATVTGGGPANTAPTAKANGPYSGETGNSIAFSSAGSIDPDGSISSYSWNFGDGSTSTSANPTHAYSAAGTYTARLTVTDNGGLTASSNATVTVTAPNTGGLVNACNTQGGQDYISLSSGTPVCVTTSSSGNKYFYFYVSSSATITLRTAHGSGNANMYYSASTWPTSSNYQRSSTGGTNTESITITNPSSGWNYVTITGNHSGVTLQMDQ